MSKMDDDVRALVEALHGAPGLATLAVTGAGSQGVAWLLGVGGASRTVLEVTVPYASAAAVGYLGFEPGEFASVEVAAGLARSARRRSVELVLGAPEFVGASGVTGEQGVAGASEAQDAQESAGVTDVDETPGESGSAGALIGVGCTAAIATDRTKRGDHRAFVGVDVGGGVVVTYALNLRKGERERAGEEDVVSRLLLNALAVASGVEGRLDLGLLVGEEVVVGSVTSGDLLGELPGTSEVSE
jgi:hypothetical protein